MATKRKIRCNFCDAYFYDVSDMVSHIEKEHEEMIPGDMTPWQFYYFLKTGKKEGKCIVDGAPTLWNEKTHKYGRICTNPKCKDTYVKTFQNRMIGKYGKVTLLNNPEQQKKMLAARSISNVYHWSDRIHTSVYTGSYELSFLEYLDALGFNPADIITPSPHNYYYMYEGKKHLYIPDVFIMSLNLEIEIKDGGSNPNTHPKIMAVDKVKEKLKDEVMSSNRSTFNYLKIVDKKNERLLEYLEKAKDNFVDGITQNIVMI